MASTGARRMGQVACVTVALATGAIGPWVSTSAKADPDPRTGIAQLEQDSRHQAIVADALAHAKESFERATRLHAVRDEAHAAEADALTLEWAAIGRDLVRAVEAEASAADVRRRATEAQAQLERSRALLEEAIARVGRLETEMARAQALDRASRVAVERHDGEPTAGTDRPPAAQKAPEPKVRPADQGNEAKP